MKQTSHQKSSKASPSEHLSQPTLGASLIEYALLVTLIAVVCVAAIVLIGQSTTEKYSAIASGFGS